ncbi:protein kinase domain-containing protein [Kocuria sp.]|uniref:protein kinase domain-containing protein n=1 Tax=Kocuria sp. TaxID=1871328 RepID=UPI0026DECCB4|nr:protein kinase [Kocuria sp.]MDO5618466.1 protein kinase [Kocuria sp.]
MTGAVLEGRYTVGPRMARGGTGGVYRAVDERLDRTVAVKIMHPHLSEDPDFVGRFAREARAAARLSHPNVVAVLDQGQTPEGLVFLVMEYVEGGTLRDVLNRKNFLTPGQAFQIMGPMLDGLASAHRAGLIHRDIKPENVLMRTDGTVKVADFGLSRGADQHTTTGAVLGTVAYAAPELVLEQPVGTRSDVYSVGILLWEMLAGRRPFTGNPWALARAHAEETVPSLTEVVPGIDSRVAHMVSEWTAKQEDQRPADAGALAAELGTLRRELDSQQLGHVPEGWHQGPGPLAPVTADPGASVLPASAPATGPVEELRTGGNLAVAEQDQTVSPHQTASAQETEALAAGSAPSSSSLSSSGRPSSEQLTEAVRTQEPWDGHTASAQTEAISTTGPCAEAPTEAITSATSGGRQGPAPRDLGVFDDTTNITGLHTSATPVGLGTTAATAADDHTRLADGRGTTDSDDAAPTRSADPEPLVETPQSDPTKPTVKLMRFPALKVLLALAVTVLLVCLAAFLGWLFGSGSFRTEVVPAVVGTSAEQAESVAADQGFGNVRVYEQSSTDVPAGSVLGTSPTEGTSMRVGEQLSILVSSGPAQVSVPSIEGVSQDEATSRLENAGLSAGQITTEFSDSAEGTVIAVSPVVSTKVDEGSSVDLTVSAGAEPTEVPSVVGSSIDDATSQLEDLGFTVQREDVAGGRLGRVISQSQDGTTITLRVI